MMHVVILIFSSWNFSLNIRSSRESPSQYVKQTISRFTSLDGDYWRFATDLCAPKRFMVPRAIFFSWCRIIMLSSPRIHFRNTLNTCFAKASTHIFVVFMAFYWLPPDRMCRSDTRIEILIDDWTLLRRAICGKWSCSMKRSRLWFWFIFERSLMTHFRDFLQIRGRSATILAESLECVRNKWQRFTFILLPLSLQAPQTEFLRSSSMQV